MTQTPDLLLIGHASRDLLPDGGWRLGGTVTYAAAAAAKLGMRPAVVTSGPDDVAAAMEQALPEVPLAVAPAPEATTFENVYDAHSARRQLLRGRAATLGIADVPAAWRDTPVVLLAPLAREVDYALAGAFPGALIAATPQGWLRRWDTAGQVFPGPLERADELLPHLDALILSREDLLPPAGMPPIAGAPATADEADKIIASWAHIVPLVAITRGAAGALLYERGLGPETYPSYPAHELDPTGAGDVFAAALLAALAEGQSHASAMDFANRVAALSVESAGPAGVPSRAQLTARYGAEWPQ